MRDYQRLVNKIWQVNACIATAIAPLSFSSYFRMGEKQIHTNKPEAQANKSNRR